MIRKIFIGTVFFAVSAVAGAATPATDASAAKLSVNKGTVMVNNGSQFVTAKPGQALKAGDRVMVMEGGTATLTYADGSTFTVPSGSLMSVGFDKPSVAHANASSVKKIGPMYAAAAGDTYHEGDSIPVGYYVMGGVLVAITVAILLDNKSPHHGISSP